ncbi:MAG: TDT family transporter [Duodenibacillus sp.]|nr:TDT family transporter [Duodenibacillus sp.]
MLKSIPQQFRNLPTPMAGLALGVASLGVCLELALPLHGAAQVICALIAAVLLGLLSMRYIFHFDTLAADLRHPVLGSIAPTFAMCLMVLSKTLGMVSTTAGTALWLFAVLLHVVFLVVFAYNRFKTPGLDLMVPSWFVPPVGLIVADVTFPGAEGLYPVAIIILAVGMAAYAVMLPVMLYRIFFYSAIPAGAQPTIAIMAAPASLSLAGYLTVVKAPKPPCGRHSSRHRALDDACDLLCLLAPAAPAVFAWLCGLYLPDGDRRHGALQGLGRA